MKDNTKELVNKLGRLFAKYESYRNRGSYWKDIAFGYLSIPTIRDAILVGGVAKLSMFPNLSVWTFVILVFIAGLLVEFIKMFVGCIDMKFGIWEKQQDWIQRNATINPWNKQTENTLKEVCKGLNIKDKYND